MKEMNENLRNICVLLDRVVNHSLPRKGRHGAQSYVEHDFIDPANLTDLEWNNLDMAKEDYWSFKQDLLRIALRQLDSLVYGVWDEVYEMGYEEEKHVCELIDATEEMIKEKYTGYLELWWPSKVENPPKFPVLWSEPPLELQKLVGVSIPWKVDYGDGEGYETFVGDAVEWNYDDSNEWGLVNYEQTRWMNLETAKKWSEEE